MYENKANWSSPEEGDPPPCFRQGDVVLLQYAWPPCGVPFANVDAVKLEVEIRREPVVLLSPCCDLVNRMPPKRKGVLIAPLREVPKNVSKRQELLDALIARVDSLAAGTSVPQNLIYYAALGDEIPRARVIYLEQMTMIPMQALSQATKIAELTQPGRREVQERIKFFFTHSMRAPGTPVTTGA